MQVLPGSDGVHLWESRTEKTGEGSPGMLRDTASPVLGEPGESMAALPAVRFHRIKPNRTARTVQPFPRLIRSKDN